MISISKLVLTASLVLASVFAFAQTKIIAHRGFSSIAPENTLEAFQMAIDANADYFELDIHQSKDDSLMVIHDAAVDRTSSRKTKGKISEMTYSELKAIKVGYVMKFKEKFKNEGIPTLRESLKLAKGKIKVCIEIKVYGVEKEVLAIINDLKMSDEVIIFSFHYPVLAKIRELDKRIPTLYLIDTANEATLDYAKIIEANAIGVGYGTPITKEYLKLAHNQGLEIWKWTVNEENEMQQLIDLGLDGLITNFPEKAIKRL